MRDYLQKTLDIIRNACYNIDRRKENNPKPNERTVRLMNIINNFFANADYTAEAESYIFNGMTDRDEIKADVRENFIDGLKENGIFEIPTDFENDVDEYTDNIMRAIENA